MIISKIAIILNFNLLICKDSLLRKGLKRHPFFAAGFERAKKDPPAGRQVQRKARPEQGIKSRGQVTP